MKPLIIKAQEIVDLPKMVAPLPYLNFLRYYRRKHPRMSLVKILQLAPAEWDALSTQKRGLFHKKVMHDLYKIYYISQYLYILYIFLSLCSASWLELHVFHAFNVCVCCCHD